MPISVTDLPLKKPIRAVALLLEGGGDGSETITGPVALDIRRHGYKVTVNTQVDGVYFEIPCQNTDFLPGEPVIQFGWDDHSGPNWGEGTGFMRGIALIGLVARNETDGAALARLAAETPDIRGRWAAYIHTQFERDGAIVASLNKAAESGFGTGLPMAPKR